MKPSLIFKCNNLLLCVCINNALAYWAEAYVIM